MKDIEIAQKAYMKPIHEIANQIGLLEQEWEPYGRYKGKLDLSVLDRLADKEDGRLILVTAMSPTPAGEGKSTVTIGLAQALNRLGHNTVVAIREPSLGPNFGMKGGAAGGGYSQVLPMEDINLHFTGDFHAITTAHNLLASLIDNHLQQGNQLNMDPRRIVWKRVLDINDRALRNITIGLGGKANGVPRESGFDITVASEIMAVLCLATNRIDLKQRLSRMLIGYTYDNQPVYVQDLSAQGAMALVLKDAIKPNLVQTLENTPAIIHGGPFGNIAHGCNSLIATRMALKLGEYVVTEAGFGSDLGAEKFLHIKTRVGELKPALAVMVATVRALKFHGGVGKEELGSENLEAIHKGFRNLEKHVQNMQRFGLPVVVSLNRFTSDTDSELECVQKLCEEQGFPVAVTEVWEKGGAGGIQLAETILEQIKDFERSPMLSMQYKLEQTIEEKIRSIVQKIYGGQDVQFTEQARKQIKLYSKHGWDGLPICMAKTQYSFSDDPTQVGRPEDFTITVREIRPSLGAGFLVALTGDIMTMPGLPKLPAALRMDIAEDGTITGLF